MVAKGLAGKKFSSGGARQPWWRERFWDPSQILLGSDLGLARALTVGAVGPDLKSRLKVLGCPRQGRQIISRSVRSSLQTDLVYPSYSLKIVLTPPFYSLKSKFLKKKD